MGCFIKCERFRILYEQADRGVYVSFVSGLSCKLFAFVPPYPFLDKFDRFDQQELFLYYLSFVAKDKALLRFADIFCQN